MIGATHTHRMDLHHKGPETEGRYTQKWDTQGLNTNRPYTKKASTQTGPRQIFDGGHTQSGSTLARPRHRRNLHKQSPERKEFKHQGPKH